MIPFEIKQAIIQVCGSIFWYKDPLRDLFLTCGVNEELYDRYADESKFKIARHILSELDKMGESGDMTQKRIVSELCLLKNIQDESVVNKALALDALRNLKRIAYEHDLIAKEIIKDSKSRVQADKDRQKLLDNRSRKLTELKNRFNEMIFKTDDRQSRGYDLESFLTDLFQLHEISYRPPYRASNEQIDGHFSYDKFDYLVEARWREKLPTESDFVTFKRKVDKKIDSTRGLFVSIPGFNTNAINEFKKGSRSKIILMDGQDISLILEGIVSLTDALNLKIEKAVQEGIIYSKLSDWF